MPHSGLGAALNRGIELTKTEFLARMDADDLSMPNRLEAQLNYLQDRPTVGCVGTSYVYTVNGSLFGKPVPMPLTHEQITRELSRRGNAVCHGTMMMRTELLRRIGGYRINGIGEDYDLFLRLATTTRMANLPKVHYAYRIHNGAVTVRSVQQVVKAYDYAHHCASRRKNGLPEPSLDAYLKLQHKETWFHRMISWCNGFSWVLAREAVADGLTGRRLTGMAKTLLAGLVYPPRVLARLGRIACQYSRHGRRDARQSFHGKRASNPPVSR